MIFDWLHQIAMRRAAKRYAKRLPAEMAAGWGASEFYAPGQVKTALGHLGLHGRYEAIAYAAFLTEEDFSAWASHNSAPTTFEEARTLFERYCPRSQSGAYHYDPISDSTAINRNLWGAGFN
jgi:hypothetical protein